MEDHCSLLHQGVKGRDGVSIVTDLEMGLQCEQLQQMMSRAMVFPGYDRPAPPPPTHTGTRWGCDSISAVQGRQTHWYVVLRGVSPWSLRDGASDSHLGAVNFCSHLPTSEKRLAKEMAPVPP